MLEFDFFADETSAPAAKAEKKPWTVSHLNKVADSCLSATLSNVWITGEVSNFKRYPSGHSYFSLKDASSQVSCTMFRGALGAESLRDGIQIEVFGKAGIYEQRGQFQIVVRRAQACGTGELEARLRALQEKLRSEGLFDQSRKRPLPLHPVRVGVVTSPKGAAIHDFCKILRRRAPHIEVFIAPVRVQGRGAADEIACAVDNFSNAAHSNFPSVDIIIVTRGGGSLEDLWEFNEEVVARSIAASSIPVISAVGHEIDFTTADLVADLRAPTPSAAAEILSSDRKEIIERLSYLSGRIHRELTSRLAFIREQVKYLASSHVFRTPRRKIEDAKQRIDDLLSDTTDTIHRHIAAQRDTLARANAILHAHSPTSRLTALYDHLTSLRHRRDKALIAAFHLRRHNYTRFSHALRILGPQQTLNRGFTITMGPDRRPLTSTAAAAKQNQLITRFADGEITSRPN